MKTELAIGIICILGMIFTGCSQHESKEKLTFTINVQGRDVPVEWSSSVKGVQWFYFSKYKEIEHVTPFSSTCVGEIVAVPDPNSISASGGLVGDIIRTVITKGQ